MLLFQLIQQYSLYGIMLRHLHTYFAAKIVDIYEMTWRMDEKSDNSEILDTDTQIERIISFQKPCCIAIITSKNSIGFAIFTLYSQ